jgi:hypothetical protein
LGESQSFALTNVGEFGGKITPKIKLKKKKLGILLSVFIVGKILKPTAIKTESIVAGNVFKITGMVILKKKRDMKKEWKKNLKIIFKSSILLFSS